MIEGVWHTDEPASGLANDGKYRRSVSNFRNWITPDGAPGPGGEGGFEAESGRYHLYTALGCPWAHRTMIVRILKGFGKYSLLGRRPAQAQHRRLGVCCGA